MSENPNFNKPHEKKFSRYKRLVVPDNTLALSGLYQEITTCLDNKAIQDQVQLYLAKGDKAKARQLKKSLPCVSVSCVCHMWRNEDNIDTYTSYLTGDVDGLSPDEITQCWERLASDQYVQLLTLSPSYGGIKFVVEGNQPLQDHREAFPVFKHYFERLIGKQLDPTGSDPTRIFFIPWCPQAILQSGAIFDYTQHEPPPLSAPQPKSSFTPSPSSSTSDPLVIAAKMIREAADGRKHNILLRASILLGGYVAGGGIDESAAISTLEYEISQRTILDFKAAQKTIADGIKFGKTKPIYK